MHSHAPLNDPLLTRADVLRVTTLGATKFKELVRVGQFPPPVQITAHRVAWRSSSVQAYINALPVADAYQNSGYQHPQINESDSKPSSTE